MRIAIAKLSEHVGKEVNIAGWVNVRRDHGKLIFVELRDSTGLIQSIITPASEKAYEIATQVRNEWVVSVKGIVKDRPAKMVKSGVINGSIELEITDINILNEAMAPGIDIHNDGYGILEEVRMAQRHLDLRRSRMQRNLRKRSQVNSIIRKYLGERQFIEVETPLLTKSTPEGARDFVVPSRQQYSSFYALPQSPQQYKQLLMASGVEKYYQIARCFRDEGSRADRQPEFTQLDMELAFTEREEILRLNESLLIQVVRSAFPEKKIQSIPFPRLTYKEAIEKYGTDCPDLRENKSDPNELAFCWIVDYPFFKVDRKTGNFTFTHNPFSAPIPEHEEMFAKRENILEITANQYDIVLNGFEIGGGSIRNHRPENLQAVFEIMGYSKERIMQNFGHMLTALSSGAPPHGGIAWGIDRVMSILLNEPSIREVIAFPKTGEGYDLFMSAPSQIDKTQLKELGITFK